MDKDAEPRPGEAFNGAGIVRNVGEYCRNVLGIDAGARVLVAVSGGADSMALFHVLDALGYTLEIAHVDHQTRGGASTRDAAFVRDMAARHGVPVHIVSVDVAAEVAGSDESFEMGARRVRYEFLLRTAHERGIAIIATGHHADDQAETVLLRILRGAGGRGLGGIPPARPEGAIRIVRPLLHTRRTDLVAFLAAHDVAFRVDSTNDDTIYARNRVRHALIPLLERDYNPQVVAALNRLAETQRIDRDYLESLADDAEARVVAGDAVDRAAFVALHEAVRRRVFQKYAWRLGVSCDHDRIVAGCVFVAEGRTGAAFDLGAGILLRNGAGTTEVAPSSIGDSTECGVALRVPGTTEAFARLFTLRYLAEIPARPLAEYCDPRRQVFDADAAASLHVRRCRPGDRFAPLGMTGSRKLSDYLGEFKLSPSERAAQLLLVSEDTIVWVVGHAVGAAAAVSPSTRRLLEVEVRDACQ